MILRLMNKWLKAGVTEEGKLHYPEQGTPQGGVISPLLANVYRHYVLDEGFDREVKPRLISSADLIRFADDAVLLMSNERDAARTMKVLPKRFSRFVTAPGEDKGNEVQTPREKQYRLSGVYALLGKNA